MTAPDPVAALREEVAEVLAGHRVNYLRADTSCDGCDWEGEWHDEAGWERHLADALLAHLAPLVEARERVEALATKWDQRADLHGHSLMGDYYARRAADLRAANALTPTEERP